MAGTETPAVNFANPPAPPAMGGGRPLPPNQGTIAGPPYLGPGGVPDWSRPIPGINQVPLAPTRPRGQRLPSARDERGRAIRVGGPYAPEGRIMPPAWKGQAAILNGPANARF